MFTLFMIYYMILDESYKHEPGAFCLMAAAKFLLLPALLYFLASCQFAPPQANRMWAFRVVATAVLLISFLPCFALSLVSLYFGRGFLDDWAGFFCLWAVLTPYPFIFLTFLAMHEREQYGFRLRRNIPKSFLGRLFVFPFYTGDYNALLWISFWITLSSVAVLCYEGMSPYENLTELSPLFSAVLLTYGYASFTLYLWSKFLYKWVAKQWLGAVAFALIISGMVLNYGIVYFTASDLLDGYMLSPFLLFVPNYFFFLDMSYHNNEWSIQLFSSLGVFALFFAVNLRETVRMFRTFKVSDRPPDGHVR